MAGISSAGRLAKFALPLFCAATPAVAQDFPTRAMRIAVPFVAGGGLDANARLAGAKMHELLKQPVIVENRGGQAGNIGTAYVAKAPPDG